MERETSWQLADYTTLDAVPREYESVRRTKEPASSSTVPKPSAKSYYQDMTFQRSSGENDYTSLVGMDKAAGDGPDRDACEKSTAFSTNGSERKQTLKKHEKSSRAEVEESKATPQTGTQIARQQAAGDLRAQRTTTAASHAPNEKDSAAKQPGTFQERNVKAVFGCLLLFCLLISVGSGILAGLALSRASSSSDAQVQPVSTLLSSSSPSTRGPKGEVSPKMLMGCAWFSVCFVSQDDKTFGPDYNMCWLQWIHYWLSSRHQHCHQSGETHDNINST